MISDPPSARQDHGEIRGLLHAYADGEPDLINAREVEQHLRNCDECRRSEEQIHTLREVLTSDGPAYCAPARLRKNIRAALRREAKETSFSPWLVFATGAAFAAIDRPRLQRFVMDPSGNELLGCV